MPAYGWKPQKPDHRDYRFAPDAKIRLPGAVDLTPKMPPIYDQGQLGSCTANGTAALFEYQAAQQGEHFGTPSRLFIYAKERDLEGTPLSDDSGAEVRDGLKVLAKYGVPPESEWPYSDANPGPFQQEPPARVAADAVKHEALQYKAIDPSAPGAPMRSAIASGLPIVFGFSVPSSFEDGSWDPASQFLPLPGPTEGFIGGHCVVVTGYDFTRSRFSAPVFKCRNSWGPDWGELGSFYLHYRWFDPDPGLATDLWVLQRVS